MAKYEVVRSFPSYTRGQVVELPEHKAQRLVRSNYLKEIVDIAEDVQTELPIEAKPAKQKGVKHGSNKKVRG